MTPAIRPRIGGIPAVRVSSIVKHINEGVHPYAAGAGIVLFEAPYCGHSTRHVRPARYKTDVRSYRMVDQVSEIIEATRSAGRTALLEPEAYQVCELYGIPVAPWKLAETVEAAVHHAEALGYPIVLKVVSPEILHKSDVGGVIVDLKTPHAVRSAYHSILKAAKHHRPDAAIRGLLVQKMAAPSTEVVIGLTRDPTFGPALMFGLGGVFVEVLNDVSFRIAPITVGEAGEMIREIKAFQLLAGVRGREPADIDALVDILLKVSRLGIERDAVDQVDLNPVFAYSSGAIAVDARILLTDQRA